jgi:hypothetical protein
VGEVSPLNELYQTYRDKGFEFFTVYVREPHPGEYYHEHRSYEEKLQYARDCREQDCLETTLLIDDLEGTVHRMYGEMPNMVYIVLNDGRVAYRAMWTDHRDVAMALEEIAAYDEAKERGERRRASYSDKLAFIPVYGDLVRDRVFGRAGPKSAEDYFKAIKSVE